MKIEYTYDPNIKLETKITSDIEKAVMTVLLSEQINTEAEIHIHFADNETIRRINNAQRKIDKVTDVLSFPLYDEKSQIPYKNKYTLGDIVISTEKAKEQAMEYGHTLEREILYLIIHSMLHLLGYDHIDESDKQIMRGKEKSIVKMLGVYKKEAQ